jgi:hypothetical protein
MAKKNPSTRWFFRDFHNDEGLQLCSLAARGAWIELLGLCAENDGYLLIAGTAPSIAAMARYVGTTPATMGRLLRELEQNGVFSRTEEGVIFNRRMVRANGIVDHKTSKTRIVDDRQNELNFQADDPRLTRTSHARDKAFKLSRIPCPESEPDSESSLAARAAAINSEVQWTQEPSSCANGSPSGRDVAPCIETRASSATTIRSAKSGERSEKSEGQGSFERPAGALEGIGAVVGNPATPRPPPQPARARPPDCRSAAAARPRPPPKTPALKAKIRDQLITKCGRFLTARKRPEEVAAYWAAMLDDDPAVAQRMLDATDRRMRRAGWDDMREWRERGWRAIGDVRIARAA